MYRVLGGRILVIYWCDYRGQALLLGYCLLARFWAENAAGFFAGVVFLGFRVSLLLNSLPPSSSPSPPFSPAWVPFLLLCLAWRQDSGLPVPGQAGHSTHEVMSFLSPLSARVGRLPYSSSLFLPLSLSLSLSLFASMHRDPASSHTLVL